MIILFTYVKGSHNLKSLYYKVHKCVTWYIRPPGVSFLSTLNLCSQQHLLTPLITYVSMYNNGLTIYRSTPFNIKQGFAKVKKLPCQC